MTAAISTAEALVAAGCRDDAIVGLIAALDAPGAAHPAEAWLLLCRQLYASRRIAEGEAWARRGVAQHPAAYGLWNVLGVCLRSLGRGREALAALERATTLAPAETGARINRGNVLLDLGEADLARAAFTALLAAEPENPSHRVNLGRALAGLGQMDAAVALFREAAARDPQLVTAWLHQADALKSAGRIGEAEATLDEGLATHSDAPMLLEAKGILLRTTHQTAKARAFFEDLALRMPDAGWLCFALGDLVANEDRARGNALLRRAVALQPGALDPLFALVQSLERTTGPDEAAALEEAGGLARQALAAGRARPHDLLMLHNVFARLCAFDDLDRLGSFEVRGRAWAAAGLHTGLLRQLPRVRSDADRLELVEQHRIWGRAVEAIAAQAPIARPPPRRRDGVIRLGLMSSDLRRHPVTYFARPLFEHRDRSRFELYAYSYFVGPQDEVQAGIAASATAFRWWPQISPREAAQRIAEDNLDVLIELGASTAMNKLEVMAYRPAPRQASWLGYPHSAGLSTIDRLICDRLNTPTRPELMVERPLVMPQSWITLGAEFAEAIPPEPEPPQVASGYVTFGTANQPYKYTPLVLKTWARIVARVAGARFAFIRPEAAAPSFRANVAAAFAAEGVTAERLVFHAVRGAHLKYYNHVDVSLDTFPLTGGTTTVEALWMGVPVVSLEGRAFHERLSRSILTNSGLGDLSVETLADYERMAVALAQDVDHLRDLRATLRGRIRAGALGRPDLFARDFYAMITAWVDEGIPQA